MAAKSNCILFAVPRWLARGKPREQKYLVIRFSRMAWGFVHFLYGEMDPLTGQIAVTSYKPPLGHQKTGLALTFKGAEVEGDALVRWVELSEEVPGQAGH